MGKAQNEGRFFDLKAVVLEETSFDEIFSTFGEAVAAAAIAKGSTVKPQIFDVLEPPRVGGAEALKKRGSDAAALDQRRASQRNSTRPKSKGQLTLAIGVWTEVIAAMLCLALLSGQYHYLRGQFPPITRGLVGLAGGLAVGFVGGAAGQGLFLVSQVSAFRIMSWMLMGGLAGTGLSLFIPNLKWFYGLAGGAIGGAVGGAGYIAASEVNDLLGRVVGGLIVGLCIGIMVAIVEAAFRRGTWRGGFVQEARE